MKRILLVWGMFLALAASPAAAQDAASAETPSTIAPFDPARLAAARITVDHIFPAGTYGRLMNGSMSKMLDGFMTLTGAISLHDVAAVAGLPPVELAKLGKTTLADIMAILDPVHDQRRAIAMHTTMAAVTNIMTELEPSIREGVAQAYACRFSLGQLSDINHFFDTPSGRAYAADALTIQTDPAVMSRMQAIVPLLMQRLPGIMAQASQATAKLPPPRKFADLSPADRERLAGLLSIPEARLEANAKATK